MKVSEIKLGSLLEIYIRRDGYNYKVISKVEYVDDTRVGVSPIASRTSLFRFKSTDIVDLVYRVDSKSWKWSKVKAGTATLNDGTKLHVFMTAEPSEVFNRRNTYRLPMSCEIDITYEIANWDETDPESKRNNSRTPELSIEKALSYISEAYQEIECKAYLRDLSEGGAAIFTNTELRKGDIVHFEFPYGEDTVKCRALVIRQMPSDNPGYRFGYGLNYIETSNNYVSFFFAEQRKMLREEN